MKLYPIVLITIILLIVGVDYFFFHKLKRRNTKKLFQALHLLPGVLFILLFLYMRWGLGQSQDYLLTSYMMWIVWAFALLYMPKLLYVVFHFLNFSLKKMIARRTNLLRWVGVVVSITTFCILLYGALIAPRDVQVRYVHVSIKNLPLSFEGYKIVQLSDMHLGNWKKDYRIMDKIIPLSNEQQADIIVFTGDMVNNFGAEIAGWEPYFNQLKAKYGKFAVLGNHDYGDYSKWSSAQAKALNLVKTKEGIRELGFQLLLNNWVTIRHKTDSLALIGVENWGTKAHVLYGNLEKAMQGTESYSTKILLSHDPTLWDAQVVGKKDIALTLSGHTHASQFGLYVNQQLLSPSSLMYEEWDGLYQKGQQYLFVNRGLGFVGIPMRIGVPPEITVIILHKSKD